VLINITLSYLSFCQYHIGEHWISLPQSIFGAAVCFLIVNHENYLEVTEDLLELDPSDEKYAELEAVKTNIEFTFRTRCVMLCVEIVVTFLIQGVLIYSVYVETPPPYPETSGLCTMGRALQLAAIATLTLWTISSYSDIWTELRCYISKACKKLLKFQFRFYAPFQSFFNF
jgi:hypothetical protein